MINSGILNPQMLSLLARVRHTNALVIADRGFPFWPQIETVDVSVVDDCRRCCNSSPPCERTTILRRLSRRRNF